MKYVRFGEIPKNGKSINFLKMTFQQLDDFKLFMDDGKMEKAFSIVPEVAWECGISAFKADENNMPVLENLQQVSSLLSRLDCNAYILEGEQIGTGNDAEPLVKLSGEAEKIELNEEALVALVLDFLHSRFQNAVYSAADDEKNNSLNCFVVERKKNKKTGEITGRWDDVEHPEDWTLIPSVREYCINGWTFTDPIEGFDIHMGIRG